MKTHILTPVREFAVGRTRIRHCVNVELGEDEQVTLVTESGTEFDVVRKSWGYYATPSLNGRLPQHGLRAVLVRNQQGRIYLLLVERGREEEYASYRRLEQMEEIGWLDQGWPPVQA